MRYSRAPAAPLTPSGTNRAAVSRGAPTYPSASPPPPRYSSPGTPTGTTAPPASSTYAWVSTIGPPIGSVIAPAGTTATGYAVANVVTSVGPYTCAIRRGPPAVCSAATQRGSTASPPNSRVSSPASAPGASRPIWCTSAVVRNSVVTPAARTAAPSAGGDTTTAAGSTTSRPPCSHAPHISNVAASNATVAACPITVAGPSVT